MHASRLLIVEDHPILADALRMNVLQLLPRVQCLLLSQLAHGKSCAEIAGQMNITESTVRSHMHAIYRRLGVVNKSQASTRYWLWAAGHGRGHH